jgi:hypothetical protein
VGLKNIIQWQTQLGEKVTVGDVSLTPQSRALILHWPGGGLVWNRPVAVVIKQGDRLSRLPIVDVTRLAQISLLGLSATFTLILLILSVQQKRGKNE